MITYLQQVDNVLATLEKDEVRRHLGPHGTVYSPKVWPPHRECCGELPGVSQQVPLWRRIRLQLSRLLVASTAPSPVIL